MTQGDAEPIYLLPVDVGVSPQNFLGPHARALVPNVGANPALSPMGSNPLSDGGTGEINPENVPVFVETETTACMNCEFTN